jgi:hypothetical protein
MLGKNPLRRFAGNVVTFSSLKFARASSVTFAVKGVFGVCKMVVVIEGEQPPTGTENI